MVNPVRDRKLSWATETSWLKPGRLGQAGKPEPPNLVMVCTPDVKGEGNLIRAAKPWYSSFLVGLNLSGDQG
jgi:hypothetical protein